MTAKKRRPLPGAAKVTGADDIQIIPAASDKNLSAQISDSGTATLSVEHEKQLAAAAIPADFARRWGIRSVARAHDLPENLRWAGRLTGAVPGLLFPWRAADGQVTYQLRPDEPVVIDGEDRKYLQPKGSGLINVLGCQDGTDTTWIVEGTKQAFAAAAYAPKGTLVVGIGGCNGWSQNQALRPDLAALVANRKAVVTLDADVGTNPRVHKAAAAMLKALKQTAATDVRYARLAAGGTAGLDDVLGQLAGADRPQFIHRLISKAVTRLPKLQTGESDKSGVPAGPRPPAGRGPRRPVIDVSRDRLQVIDETVEALRERWDGGRLFGHGSVLIELEGTVMHPLDRGRLRRVLAETAEFVRPTRGGLSHVWPDNGVLEALSASADRFAPLDSIARVPFVREDGSICQRAGYDRVSRTFLALIDHCAESINVPDRPTREQVESAIERLLTDWLGDFSFATRADRANALALIATPFMRRHMDLVPMAVIDGVAPGVGKGLLADCWSIVVTGDPAEPLPSPSNDDETRKVITSAFERGSSILAFDEAHFIGGNALARALTASIYTDRILGSSRMASYPNYASWAALGNNVQVFGDLGRRVYRVAIRPEGSNPEHRPATSFRHPDLREWTRQNRWRLVEAILTVIRAWFVAGRPVAAKGVSFGSFEQWDRTMGGVLDVAGVPGFLEHLMDWRGEADPDTEYWTEHLRQLKASFDEALFTVAEVVDRIEKGAITETPPGMEEYWKPGYARELGKRYGRVNGRWYGSLRLVRKGTPETGGGAHGSVNRWAVEALKGKAEEGTEGWEGSTTGTRESLPPPPPPPRVGDGTSTHCATAPQLDPSDPSDPSVGRVVLMLETAPEAELFTSSSTPFLRKLRWRSPDGVAHSSAEPAVVRQVLTDAPALLTYDDAGVALVAAARHLGLSHQQLAVKTRDLALEARLADPPTNASEHGYYSLARLSDRLLGNRTLDTSVGDAGSERELELIGQLGDVVVAPDPEYAAREARIASLAGELTLTGLRVDEPELRRRQASRKARAEEVRAHLIETYGFPARTGDGKRSPRPWQTKAGGQHFRELGSGFSWPLNTNGSPLLTREALAYAVDCYAGTPFAEVCALILEAQAGNSFLDDAVAYVIDGRIHPLYGLRTATGRWSSRMPNILGVGKRSAELLADRDLILAEPGDVFVGVDLSGIDARCVAGLSGDDNYARLFEPGVDIHAENAEVFLGDRKQREAAKAISHGINYGRGPKAIAAQTGRPTAEVTRMHRAYFRRYRGIECWHREIRRRGKAGAVLPTGTGRHVRVTPDNAYTEAPARLAQAAARDLALTGVLRLADAGLQPMLRLFIHDEVVLSVPEHRAEEIAAQVAALMSFEWESPSGLTIPIVAEASKGVGSRWSDIYQSSS